MLQDPYGYHPFWIIILSAITSFMDSFSVILQYQTEKPSPDQDIMK